MVSPQSNFPKAEGYQQRYSQTFRFISSPPNDESLAVIIVDLLSTLNYLSLNIMNSASATPHRKAK